MTAHDRHNAFRTRVEAAQAEAAIDRKPMTPEALASLRALCPPGTVVYTILRHVSRSGMQKVLAPVVIRDGEPLHISRWTAEALGLTYSHVYAGVVVRDVGPTTDAGMIRALSLALYPASEHPEVNTGNALSHRWL